MQGGAAGNSGSCCHRYYAGVTGFIPGPSHAWACAQRSRHNTVLYTNHICLLRKKRPTCRCYAKSPTVQDVFQQMPGVLGAGVTR